MKTIIILLLCFICVTACAKNNRYVYYNPSCWIREDFVNVISKVGDIKSDYFNGIVTEVNIHGKQKGVIQNYGIPYAEHKTDVNSENFTYIYYDYKIKVDTWSKEYQEALKKNNHN